MTFARTFLLAVSVAIVAAAATHTSPTVAAQARSGSFIWHDLATTDSQAARKFYGALLGWQFTESERNGRPYAIARAADGPVGGIVDVRGMTNAESQWISYVTVADVDRADAQVQSAGGKVIVAPMGAKIGRVSVIADPQGAVLGLVHLKGDAPVAPKPTAGHFFWREYLARDSSQALSFYKNLLGHDSVVTDTQLGLQYFVLRTDKAWAGLFQIPSTATNVRPHWLPYLLVDDPAAMAAKATTLGARVLLEPSADRRRGSLAVVADPSGGVVAFQKFPF